MPSLPRFRVHKIEDDPVRLTGELSETHYGEQTWVRPGAFGDLRIGNRFVTGRWSTAGPNWVFAPEQPSALQMLSDIREFDVFDGYWGERAEIVLDESLVWREVVWNDLDDHDHCRICWATIDSEKNRHFAASPAYRVCPRCHAFYVQPRSINFSPLGGPAE